MSDLMLFGVLRMPFEMAMSDELSQRQFYDRVQEALDRMEAAEAKVVELEGRATPPSPSTAEDERGTAVPDAVTDFDKWIAGRGPLGGGAHPSPPFIAGWLAGRRAALSANAADREAKENS